MAITKRFASEDYVTENNNTINEKMSGLISTLNITYTYYSAPASEASVYVGGISFSDLDVNPIAIIDCSCSDSSVKIVRKELSMPSEGNYVIYFDYEGSTTTNPKFYFTILGLRSGLYTSEKYTTSGGGGAACFTQDTPVLTSNGLTNIEDIKVGDIVISYNEITKENEAKEVYETFSHKTHNIYNIDLGTDTIKSSWSHEFFVQGKGKVLAKDLVVGDILVTTDGKLIEIKNIEITHEPAVVYDIKVSDNHTYYVGKDSILVYSELFD